VEWRHDESTSKTVDHIQQAVKLLLGNGISFKGGHMLGENSDKAFFNAAFFLYVMRQAFIACVV
jgi:hypothetical protein